jgi:hypothetical protein
MDKRANANDDLIVLIFASRSAASRDDSIVHRTPDLLIFHIAYGEVFSWDRRIVPVLARTSGHWALRHCR